MPHILKIFKGIVKALATLVTIAFVLNSSSGFLGALGLAEDGIAPAEIEPGDFVVNYENLEITIGIDVNNTGIYDIEDIIFDIEFRVKNDTTDWYTVLNKTSVELNSSIPSTGVTIESGNSATIGISANQNDGHFNYNSTQIGELFGFPPNTNWTYPQLLLTGFEAEMTLGFTVSYAFKQYSLGIELFFDDAALAGGFLP